MRKHFHEPEKVSLEISLTGCESVIDINKIIKFIIEITKDKENAFAFINSNGYWFNERNVFPDRVCVGWMIHIPHTVLPELIPEAARVVPVVDNGRQKGTIIVSTEDVFDGDNPVHIAKANDIEIRLLDLGFLPLMTDL